MYALSIIRQTLYRVENEPKHEVHSRSCLTGVSNPFMLTPSDIAELFNESKDSRSKVEENKTPDPSKDTLEKASN
ncbi:hypothetical protein RHGRI_030724 [Rhododendron griersonianum]|uniref:Uncharacterized protein n=1 Tax=Rhododendron griersonianum TaxID=479676 RepID=A0AAV6I575_9ERIC|nr:hypothetical protein RHGRI_030724 [Rhododendron griersonianum]